MGRQGRMAKTKRLNIFRNTSLLYKSSRECYNIYIYPLPNNTKAESLLNKEKTPKPTFLDFVMTKNCCFSALK